MSATAAIGQEQLGSAVRTRRTTRAELPLAVGRAAAVLFFSFVALVEISIRIPFVRSRHRRHRRAVWLHRWCRFACRVLGVRVKLRGELPRSGLVVSNHLSYLDIIVISSLTPSVFVAKSDVASWPLFGWLAKAAGTIFVERNRKSRSAAAVDAIREAVDEGTLVVLFPEGTSSDGASVLPLKSALLEPAHQLLCPVSAAAIDYSLSVGSVADEVCYWRDMTLLPHLLNLFTKRTVDAKLSLASLEPCQTDRKTLARELRQTIVSLRS